MMLLFCVALAALDFGLKRVREVVHVFDGAKEIPHLVSHLKRLVTRRIPRCDQYITNVNKVIAHNNPAFSSACRTAAVPMSSAVSASIFCAMSSVVGHVPS